MADPERGEIFHLNVVVMPLVRLMAKHHEFSWAHREEIAWAIQECISEYESIRQEIEKHQTVCETSGGMK